MEMATSKWIGFNVQSVNAYLDIAFFLQPTDPRVQVQPEHLVTTQLHTSGVL